MMYFFFKLIQYHTILKIFSCLLIFLYLQACAGKRPPDYPSKGNIIRTGKIFTGIASWYGGKFHGRKTASGERFDKKDFTAAHKNLPFGTLLEVTNPDNNQKVIVRINDRGPYVKRRILDLSHAAAKQIDIIQSGFNKVRAEIVILKEPEHNQVIQPNQRSEPPVQDDTKNPISEMIESQQ